VPQFEHICFNPQKYLRKNTFGKGSSMEIIQPAIELLTNGQRTT